MEGKEVRFGIANSALFSTITTAASCGAVNGMHDSLIPLGGMVALINILLGQIVVGDVGSGLYGMLLSPIRRRELHADPVPVGRTYGRSNDVCLGVEMPLNLLRQFCDKPQLCSDLQRLLQRELQRRAA